ncbi:hypothetical protein LCGC14_1749030, partial [marine sediment metagenome]
REIRAGSSQGKIALTLSVFVPKPFTPFQWQPMLEKKELTARIKLVRDGLRGVYGVSVSAESPRLAHLQGFLAQGDRRLAPVLERMLNVKSWERAAREAGVVPSWYTLRDKREDEVLPWDFIDSGNARDELFKRGQKALALISG